MASLMMAADGGCLLQFVGVDQRRRTLRFGKVRLDSLHLVKIQIERMVAFQKSGVPYDADLLQWIQGLAEPLHTKLAKAGLVEPRASSQIVALGSYFEELLKRRKDLKPATLEVWLQPIRNLKTFFGADRDMRLLTEADALDFRQFLIDSGLASATITKRLQLVRTFFNDARRRKLVDVNPFVGVRHKTNLQLDQRHYVSKIQVEKILAACPSIDWRIIISLARYGGLRCPSEVLSLRWEHIDWEKKRIRVISPKTISVGKPERVIPMFPELKAVLSEAWLNNGHAGGYVVEQFKRRSFGKLGWKSCNLRTQFVKIVRKAGLDPWPKMFHALRSSRETELAHDYPIHVVTAWLGNTPAIALRHYLLTRDEDFERAAC